ncbi:uncharacterized protein EV420DRAFT_1730985 [Desarmillaria tabescens]|uniref:Uncharacterized protein n=1 Tax=Armillaria tabescens TaxID=1929756 RepID=A0AA39JF79_ARMTA|nr:uncharacterized protein EV420DRAFT_1730985 [Desarmillaria tabescens]KAK0440696.1 hypothetical protein EV420DRAFT_1730985 [Desarmillaria tabescens]
MFNESSSGKGKDLTHSSLCSLRPFSLSSTALASPLESHQANTNTNANINQIGDALDQSVHINIPNIVTLQAWHQANDSTIGEQIDEPTTIFRVTAQDLSDIPSVRALPQSGLRTIISVLLSRPSCHTSTFGSGI